MWGKPKSRGNITATAGMRSAASYGNIAFKIKCKIKNKVLLASSGSQSLQISMLYMSYGIILCGTLFASKL